MAMVNAELAIHNQERHDYAEFAARHGNEEYRERMAVLYAFWHCFNQEHCAGRLREPHIGFSRTHPRVLGHCDRLALHGGQLQVILNEGLVFGTKTDWVVNPWLPAVGTGFFIEDLLLRFCVRHSVLELHNTEEPGYDGFGPLFVSKANEISAVNGLRQVVSRNRTGESYPLARYWPHNVWLEKDPYRYGNDVTEALLDLAAGRNDSIERRPLPPSLGTWELILSYLASGQSDRLLAMAIGHVDRLHDLRTRRLPVMRRCEAGLDDINGEPLGEVTIDPQWLIWNNSTVRKLAEAIYEHRIFAELPILADALEDAGCWDGRILRHLRHHHEHTRQCWVIRRLVSQSGDARKNGTP
jgi:hypothetical protein